MMVTIKSKDGYNVDITSLYLKAMQKQITPEEYKNELDFITSNPIPTRLMCDNSLLLLFN